MKFNDFKTTEVEVASTISTYEPPTRLSGRQVVRDWIADPWDIEALDMKMCPKCGSDLLFKEATTTKNIAYYDCKEQTEHRFVRIFKPPSTTASTLAAAAAHT